MSLSKTQGEFLLNVAYLIQHINTFDNGRYSCTLGDGYRDPRSHGEMGENKAYGRSYSAHKQRLAVDLNLYMDGEYQTTTEAHRPFGEYWCALDDNNVWGGDFGPGGKNDGNHYSRRFGGIA